MAPPTLLIADASFTKYPGNIVVLKCDEWMGGARGSLSAENDSLAITGRAVRDTQQSTTHIFDDIVSAFNEVDDTLVISVASLPLEVKGAFSSGMTYKVWLSLRIEGDWDPSESKTTRSGTNDLYGRACEVTWYDSTYETVTTGTLNNHRLFFRPRQRPNYVMVGLGSFASGSAGLRGDEEIHLRAWSAPGTTCEILLDQLFIVPHVTFNIRVDEWSALDWAIVPGDWMDQVGVLGTFIDGADGGDANGKFTWFPRTLDGNGLLIFSNSDGGGDYQTEDSEYMVQADENNPIEITSTQPAGSFPSTTEPASEHAYSVHGAECYLSGLWVDDQFSRTDTGGVNFGWGLTPEGFAWEVLNLVNNVEDDTRVIFSTNGSQGVVTYTFPAASIGGGRAFMGLGKVREKALSVLGARVRCTDVSFKGIAELSAIPATDNEMYFILGDATTVVSGRSGGRSYCIHVDAGSALWKMENGSGDVISSNFDISSWFGAGTPLGWRIEIRRYRLRARIWDASGAEPSTWDFDDFITSGVGGSILSYPYGDNPFIAQNLQTQHDCDIELSMRTVNGPLSMTATFDAIEVEWDTEETDAPAPVNALIESPEGTERGRIEIPAGAWHVVHWGGRQWALDYEGTRDYAIDISAKVWNDPAARELQRAEAPFWWFRTIHLNIIVMNWRSADRKSIAQRVLMPR